MFGATGSHTESLNPTHTHKTMARIKPLGKQKRTAQGFPLIEFGDIVEQMCALEASTLIDTDSPKAFDNPGTSAVWLGPIGQEMHLNKNQARALVLHLRIWLKTGKFR